MSKSIMSALQAELEAEFAADEIVTLPFDWLMLPEIEAEIEVAA